MNNTLRLIISAAICVACFARALPDIRNPNLEYELINRDLLRNGTKPGLAPMTPPTQSPPRTNVVNTPRSRPGENPDAKVLAFDPVTKQWSVVKVSDPKPQEGILVWNPDNDKWLTQTARV